MKIAKMKYSMKISMSGNLIHKLVQMTWGAMLERSTKRKGRYEETLSGRRKIFQSG